MSNGQNMKSNQQPLQTTIYLDCNATTHTHPVALQAAREAMELCFGNPSSTHLTGLHAKSFLESARVAAAQAVGANDSEEIIFNSGATEGIQSSVFSVLVHLLDEFRESGRLKRWRVLYGATEHKAVPAAIHHWAEVLRIPVEIEAIPVDKNGLLALDFMEERLKECALICTMAVNNETGVIQPLEKISQLLKSQDGLGCFWFVDGVQALGKISINLSQLGAHYSCFSGHKLNAPKGIGFLWVSQNAPYTPMIVGGGQERGKRSGTENLPGAAAFGRILGELNNPQQSIFLSHQMLESCRQKLISTLTKCFPTLIWNVDIEVCVPTTLNFSVEGISSRELMNAFDAAGVRVSGGSACSSGKSTGSHVLIAMKLPKWRAENAIRLSFGPANTESDIDLACRAIQQAGEALRASCMIPNLPARAEQLAELTQHLDTGVSELRSSEGTRTWLMICDPKTSFLVSDCDRALTELKNKLACRGLAHTQILQLDALSQHSALPPEWRQLKSASGTSLLFLPSAHASQSPTDQKPMQSADMPKKGSAILFSPERQCLEELLNGSLPQFITNRTLLACFACEPTALTAYEFIDSTVHHQSSVASSVLTGFATHNSTSHINSRIECTKEELSKKLSLENLVVLDVREAFESATSHLDEILEQIIPRRAGKDENQINVKILPLSRLPQFILERLNQPREERILCVCRSGQRSLQAAELLRRLPGCESFSLKGGLADLLLPTLSLPPRSVPQRFHGKE